MIELKCLYAKLSDVSNVDKNLYLSIANSMEADFYLSPSSHYKILGILVWQKGIAGVYIIDHNSSNDIRIIPAILFDFTWQKIPPNWNIRMNKYHELEILPNELAGIEHWFEKYIDEEPVVLSIVQKMIDTQ